jgi:hypothetical protein
VIGRMHLCLFCCWLFRDLLRFPDKVLIHKVLQSLQSTGASRRPSILYSFNHPTSNLRRLLEPGCEEIF